MIRAPRLAVSRPMYAFDPTTWTATAGGYGFQVAAVWFKRRSGVLLATVGFYHPMVERRDQQPTDGQYATWVAAADDNRYGGAWSARSNGEITWFAEQEYRTGEETDRARELLAAALAAYPEVPGGYDGWWTFPR